MKVTGIDVKNTGWHEQEISVALRLMCYDKENGMIAQWQWELAEAGKQKVLQLFLGLWFIIQFNFRMLSLSLFFYFFLRRKPIWAHSFVSQLTFIKPELGCDCWNHKFGESQSCLASETGETCRFSDPRLRVRQTAVWVGLMSWLLIHCMMLDEFFFSFSHAFLFVRQSYM